MMACPARGTIAPGARFTEDEVSVDFGNPDYQPGSFQCKTRQPRVGREDPGGVAERHLEANRSWQEAINAAGEGTEAALAHFFFLALLPPSPSARPSSSLLRRTSSAGELRRPTLHRSAAAAPSIRRYGAARLDGASAAAALAAAVARFFLAVPPFLVLFFFGLVNGVPQRIMEGLLHARGRHRAPGAPPANPAVGDHAGARRGVGAQAGARRARRFGAHLDRGLGLPASTFFRRFLDHFGLQPHHLPANACVLLSCYVAFMEAYAGLWPDIDFWSRLFYLKAQTGPPAGLWRRLDLHPARYAFPKIPTVDSVKNWQMSFFYVRNEGALVDRINLPEFNPAPPVGRINWSHNARSTDPNAEVNLLWDFLATATGGGLTAEDLLCTIAERRVLPLQMRSHKIGHMSGRFDPNRTSKAPLNKAQVASRVNHITKANLTESWSYGLVPRDREHPPARRRTPRTATWRRKWTPDLVDPADQAGGHAGDDDLPQAPDLGGQHNPPPSPERAGGGGGAGDVRHGADPRRASAYEAAKHHRRPAPKGTSEPAPPPPWREAKKQRRLRPKMVPEKAG
ncbi:hypothetical protein QYE76_020244 [Lolium multiflorum]|uniref:Transposase (putative) gypsy type domain-containing protein n=1 Tax=Lolium multiflorum TaxID=4521 RepID=A0AAD8R6N2_LOLMU|nr:hypothetical protein QYE76_020244 [Lolium multiflorum]